MIPWRFTQWLTPNRMHCRRELIIALDLIAACVIAHLFLDRWLAVLLSEFRQSPAVLVLSFVPDRVQLSILFTFGMLFLIAYRAITGDRVLADRGMFVLGCGAAAGFAAHVLKIVFGRVPPEALLVDGTYEFHFFDGGSGFDSFPSSHAAMAAGVAAAASALWPEYRVIFIVLAALIAASRFLTGAHYLSDALVGFAVGLGTVVLVRMIFHLYGIQLAQKSR
jgi:membrane-associated phospholipid phosphatase